MSGIRVICRLRPENKIEQESGAGKCIEYSDYSIKISVQERADEATSHEFTFDRICGPEISQGDVFEIAARPVVDGVLEGYNGTIFAYGQTGSGKTFTMEGPNIHDNQFKGIIPRMMDALFNGLINASEQVEFTLKCSFLEIYLEKIQDLLEPSKNNLQVKEEKTRGIYVAEATEIYVSSPEEMMQVMTTGASNRSVAATRMNQRSSRSHSIFCVSVEQKDTVTNSRKSGRLYFVDLAGSEKIAKTHVTGKQLEEAKMINKSLSALGNVINALTDKSAGFIPYRDSKLTRMLQESLGGNSQTTLVIACSMNSYNDKETLSTLRFGQRAKKIQNKPIVNQEKSAKELMKKLDQANKEIQKQAEIINNIQTHINSNYSENQNLVSEVSGIIENSFEVKKSHTQTALAKHDSEHSMTLLKQHIEIVSLHEELQQIKLEKKELEDDLGARNKDIAEYEVQVNDLQQQLQEQEQAQSQETEALNLQLEKALFENQQKFLDAKRLRKTCERLNSDLLFMKDDYLKKGSSEILLKSVQEALTVLSEIDGRFNEGCSIETSETKNPSETSTVCDERATNPEDNLAESADAQAYLDLKKLVTEQRSTIASLTQQASNYQSEIEKNQTYVQDLELKIVKFKQDSAEKQIKLEEALENSELLSRQLEQKVKNIEEERQSMGIEIKYRDEQIQELKTLLNIEREQIEQIIKCDTPKKKVVEVEERLKTVYNERQRLYEEIVKLRKDLDKRDEQLHDALQRNNRLERQLASNQKANTQRLLSPRGRNQEAPLFFSKKVMKPIKGGGGDLGNFQKRNQALSVPESQPSNQIEKSQKKLERLTNANKGTFHHVFKGFFGDLLG